MRADRALERLGGVAGTRALLRLTSAKQIRTAVRRGRIVRDERGRYSLPGVEEAIRVANRLSAVLAEDSAAEYLGWPLKHRPPQPCLVVPRKRRLAPDRTRGLRVRYQDLDPDDVNGLATRAVPTVMACAARLPFDEALAVADSALRAGDVTAQELLQRAEQAPDRYRSRCLRVAEAADGRAANPFESVLRAIALDVPGLEVAPQVWVGEIGRPDLVDERRRLVIEADSFEFHGRRQAMKRDCERYNGFVVEGWLVLRFSWEHVMFDPDYVRRVLAAAVAGPLGPALARTGRRLSA